MSQRNERSIRPEVEVVAQWLIHHAARRAPELLSARLEEEWLADLEYRSSTQAKLRLALGCCWATMVIVYENSGIKVPAPSPAIATKGYVAHANRDFGYFSLRSGTLFLILGLQVALFCGLAGTFSHTRGWAKQAELPSQILNPAPVQITVLPGR